MDELIERLKRKFHGPDRLTMADRYEAATALRAFAEREKELVEALEKAERGLDVIIDHYASVASTGSRIAADEQYPWIATAMKAQNAAHAILSKHKEQK